MTDRLNDAPDDDAPVGDPAPEVGAADPTEAVDLSDAQLEAATEASEAEVEEEEAGGLSVEEAEEDEAELDEAEEDEAELDETAASGADADADAEDEDEDEMTAPARASRRRTAAEAAAARSAAVARGPRAAKAAQRTTFPIDDALRIKDPISNWFVAGSIIVFLLIFLSAMAFGRHGAFTPVRTPAPVVSPSPGVSSSPGPSSSAGATAAPSTAPASS